MVRYYYVSDIHLELDANEQSFDWLLPEEPGNLILAGDIGNPFADSFRQLIAFVVENYKHVFYVPGNHEYYSNKLYAEVNEKILEYGKEYSNFYPLLNTSVMIDGVTYVGSTLWSWIPKNEREEASRTINDYKRTSLSVEDTCKLHVASVEYINSVIKTDAKCVIITHHLPSYKLIHQSYQNFPLNCCFASHCDNLLKPNVLRWICGHSHQVNHYMQCSMNPIGYPWERIGRKLASFLL